MDIALLFMPLAGLLASLINAVVGSGALVALPVLLAQGSSPQDAVIALTLGLCPGMIGSAWGYRRELREVGRSATQLFVASGLGGLGGAVLLVRLDPSIFAAIIPFLILGSCVLLVLQPRISREFTVPRRLTAQPAQVVMCLLAGVYGALVGAGQGIILLAILLMVGRELQPAIGLKNLLGVSTNVVSAVMLIFTASVPWLWVGLIAIGAFFGGQLGSALARRLPLFVLRTIVVVVGVLTAVRILFAF